jgi:hypothetical protein
MFPLSCAALPFFILPHALSLCNPQSRVFTITTGCSVAVLQQLVGEW